jgi:glycosyltransferase involved in cell wall biosynthesis
VRIGFDVSNTGRGKTGCGHFADSLIRSMATLDADNTYLLYSAFGTVFFDEQHRTDTFRSKEANFGRRLESFSHDECRAFWSDPPPDAEEQMGRPDVIHSNSFFCPRGLRRARVVYTLFDVVCVELPETMPEAHRAIHCHELFEASLRADTMVAISEFTRRQFLALFPHYPAERVRVVHPASRFALDDLGGAAEAPFEGLSAGDFWLSVATLEPRKNLRRLLRAYARVRPRRPLALIGREGWMEHDLADFAEELGLGGDVRWLGYVGDPALDWLYRNCFAFVYVPLSEGFGLPVLEAMTLGAPVVTSHGSGLAECAGDAALIENPLDEDDIKDAIERMDQDALRARLRDRGREHSQRFSWPDVARRVLRIYHETLEAPRLASGR